MKPKYPAHYFRWRAMRSRCHNPKHPEFKRYGARGIFVCKKWREDFWAFQKWCLENFEPGKTVDRINNDGPYSPRNCRWATPLEQQLNARRVTPARLRAIKYASSCRRPHTRYRERLSNGRYA